MTTQIQFQSFNFNSNAVRVITDPTGEFWFCGSDVCDILGYQNAPLTVQKHCKQGGISKRYTPTQSGDQEMIFINEPNLYRLIIKSRKPEAEPFEAWVFEEVLPQIRKTGQYSLQNPQLNLPLAEVQADEEALQIIVNLYHSLREAHEFAVLAHDVDHRWLKQSIDKDLGGHLLHNLNHPAKNALDKAKKYIHAKSERIMFVKGMLSLLEAPKPKRIANF